MTMKVTESGSVVTVECGDEIVVIGGKVLMGPLNTQAQQSAPISGPRPDLPPPPTPGVSVSAFTPVTGLGLAKGVKPILNSFISGDEFTRFARRVTRPYVVIVEPSDLRTFRNLKSSSSVPLNIDSMLLVSKYLKND